jgi:hypothetical protein
MREILVVPLNEHNLLITHNIRAGFTPPDH